MQAGQDINVGGKLSKTEFQYTLTSTNSEELNHWAPIIEEAMAKLPELQDVTSDQQIAAPHLAIDIDRDSASRLGLSLGQIDQTLYDAFGQRQVATIYTSSTQYKVVLEVLPSFQTDPAALSRIYVTGRTARRFRSARWRASPTRPRRSPSTTRANSPPSRYRSTWRRAWRWAKRCRRSSRYRPSSRRRSRSTAPSRARRRPSSRR